MCSSNYIDRTAKAGIRFTKPVVLADALTLQTLPLKFRQLTSIDIIHRDDMVSSIQQISDDHRGGKSTGEQ